MITHWVGVVVLAAVAIARSEVFENQPGDPWPWFLIGLLAFAAGRGREQPAVGSRTGLLWLVPAALCTLAWGVLDSLPAWLVLAAASSAFAFRNHRRWAFVPNALSAAGMVLFVQTSALAVFLRFGADAHAWPWVTDGLGRLLGMLGMPAGNVDGTLLVQHSDGLHRFAPGFDQMGGLFAVLIAAGALPVLWLHASRPWRAWATTLAVLVAYGLLRYLVLIATYRMHMNPTFLWRVSPQAVTWLPCVLVLARVVRADSRGAAFRVDLLGPVSARARWLAPASLVLACMGVLATSFHDPGESKRGRVLFDEHHSDWEWTEQRMGTAEFGLGTTYNYYNLYEHLDRYFTLGRNHGPIDESTLRDCDVLVLRTPTTDYAPSEIRSIREFVERGGGVWLIGDHTNVFGTSTRMNQLSEEFGIRFRHDAEYDLETGSLNVFEVPRALMHPVVSAMPDFMFATGCTLETSLDCQPVMNVKAVNALPADYGQRSFFPREGTRQDFGFGFYTMSAAREYGSGRVLAFSDSTVFSNFFMYIPGKPELALGSIDWLNRRARFAFVPKVATWCAPTAALLLLLLTIGSRAREVFPRIVFGVLVGASAASLVCDGVTRSAYPALTPIDAADRVHFDMEHSGVFLPIARLQREYDNDYSTFFTWCQRVDLVPTVHRQLESALAEPGLLVLADLQQPLDADELAGLDRLVRSGGNLLLIHGPRGNDEAMDPVLSVFGFALGETRPPPAAEEGEADVGGHEHAHDEGSSPPAATLALAEPFGEVTCSAAKSVRGGLPLVLDETGEPVIAWSTHGAGRVIVAGCGELFCAERMGTVSVLPDVGHRQIFELVFALLRLGSGKAEPPLANLLGADFLETQCR